MPLSAPLVVASFLSFKSLRGKQAFLSLFSWKEDETQKSRISNSLRHFNTVMGRMTESSIYLMPDFKVYLGIQKGKKTLKHWFYFFFFFWLLFWRDFVPILMKSKMVWQHKYLSRTEIPLLANLYQWHICYNTYHRMSSLRWIQIINMNNTWNFSSFYNASCAVWSPSTENELDHIPTGLDGNTNSHEFKHVMLISRNSGIVLKEVLMFLLENFKEEVNLWK